MFVIKICHSYEQFYITVTKKKLSYEMHQYDKQCLLLLQKNFISVCIYNNYRLTDDQHFLKASYISSSEGVQNKVIYSSH